MNVCTVNGWMGGVHNDVLRILLYCLYWVARPIAFSARRRNTKNLWHECCSQVKHGILSYRKHSAQRTEHRRVSASRISPHHYYHHTIRFSILSVI